MREFVHANGPLYSSFEIEFIVMEDNSMARALLQAFAYPHASRVSSVCICNLTPAIRVSQPLW